MTNDAVPDTPPELPPPADAARPKRRGLKFWLLVGGVVLGIACCGGVSLAWDWASDWIAIARAPEAERNELLSKKLGELAGDQVRASDAFLAAVDERRDDDAWAMTAPALRDTTTREKFVEHASLVRGVVGRLRSKQLRNFDTRNALGGTTTATLLFGATFEKGDGTIKMTLSSTGDGWKVVGWHTDSPLFNEAMKRGAGK